MGQPIIRSGPNAEFQDIERRKLITELLKTLRNHKLKDSVSLGFYNQLLDPLGWTCLWLSDIRYLEQIVNDFKEDPLKTAHFIRGMLSYGGWGPSCTCRDFTNGITEQIADVCRKRDGKCIITQAEAPTDVYQILPSSHEPGRCASSLFFWDITSRFWGETINISELKKYVDKTTETAENYILLDMHAGAHWNEQLFALEPLYLSNNKRTMKLRFFWLFPDNLDSVKLSTAVLPEDPNEEFLVEPPLFSADNEHEEWISSGQTITLTTEDPDTMPLPDLRFLRLQWLLHRVVSLTSAAGYQKAEGNRDEEDDIKLESYPQEEGSLEAY